MNIKKTSLLFTLCFLLFAGSAFATAGWDYVPYGTTRRVDGDSKFTISLRGGGAFGMGKMQNDLGALVPEPFWQSPSGDLVGESGCGGSSAACQGAGYTNIGSVDIAKLPVSEKLSTFSWTGAVAVGFTLPNAPNWRLEANWDHIGRAEYDSLPLLQGDATTETGTTLFIQSGGVSSTVETDIFSMMFYYDFHDGCDGPKGTCRLIPYVGIGFGYATSNTEMSLTDAYGNLSDQASMQYFGTDDGSGTLNFYTSQHRSDNFSLSGAAGFSYGLTDYMFLDIGLRFNYIPQIKWELNNLADASAQSERSKDMFSAKNVIYSSILMGLRFEF